MYLIILFIFIFSLQLEDTQILAQQPSAYCFKFTWLGPMIDENSKKVNCTKDHKNNPCFQPFITTPTPPNTEELWIEDQHKYSCTLSPGYVCIKHTYSYNNAVINSTHFCGKMIEDKTSAVTSKCFSQKIDGHTIESCACVSDQGMPPCNSAKVHQYSYIIFLILLLIQII
ncbi:uncharacterized protein LOC127286799 [Leptopilina boulardi]|uniref:uncharacterized protein LOC127286799 n=1 Tax=Leptopilina boulardi TaxID=63433 RepID=UPI0021F5322A|nr:uncharacterized protein LOC127286799 [Leptopilina boulardi]